MPVVALDPIKGLPGSDCVNVTPSDTDDVGTSAAAYLLIGTAGALKITTAAGTSLIIPSAVITAIVANGGRLDIRVTRVWSTGTAASNIVAVF
jgi:hypothetical protein